MLKTFKIHVSKSSGVCVVHMQGELRLGDATRTLRSTARSLLEHGERRFVFDLLDVSWLDSSGMGEVFACYKRARAQGAVVKLALRGKTRSMFTLTQLDQVFEIFEDTDAAVDSF